MDLQHKFASRRRTTLAARAAVVAAAATLLAGCSGPLPEEGSADAALYADRCGGCHKPQQPSTLTAKMWDYQVQRMDQKYREAGRPLPSAEERERILAYLTRHAAR